MRLGAALVLIALAWLWLVRTEIPDAGAGWPGPRGFPQLLGVVLAVLGVWMMAAGLGGSAARVDERTRPTDTGELPVAAGTLGVLVLYAFLLERAGFLIATPLVIVLAMAGLLPFDAAQGTPSAGRGVRLRRWLPIVSLAAGFTFGCWIIFEALGTPLPRGSWIGW